MLKNHSLEYTIDKVLHDWSLWYISMLLKNDMSPCTINYMNRLRE